MSVSRQWRQAALATPSLWTRINLYSLNYPELFNEASFDRWLSLSGSALLNVHVDLSSESILHSRKSAVLNDKMFISEKSRYIITSLLNEASRLESLSFDGTVLHLMGIISGLHRARALRYLELSALGDSCWSEEALEVLHRTENLKTTLSESRRSPKRETIVPSLSKLCIRDSSLYFLELNPLIFPNLKELILDEISCEDSDAGNQLALLIARSSTLSRLEMRHSFKQPSSWDLLGPTLPQLLYLKIFSRLGDTQHEWINELMKRSPKLISLELGLIQTLWIIPNCSTLLSLSLCLDRTDEMGLEFEDDIEFTEDIVSSVYRALPSLRNLPLKWVYRLESAEISWYPFVKLLIEPCGPANHYLCPLLRRLDLQGVSDIREGDLLQLSHKRNTDPQFTLGVQSNSFEIRVVDCFELPEVPNFTDYDGLEEILTSRARRKTPFIIAIEHNLTPA